MKESTQQRGRHRNGVGQVAHQGGSKGAQHCANTCNKGHHQGQCNCSLVWGPWEHMEYW